MIFGGPSACCGGDIQGLHELMTSLGWFAGVIAFGVLVCLLFDVVRKW